ncbi:MAG: NTP transferase domain-containing protein [Candidatus Omnitrophica bacterium]|nr:NTP transferase domain-containing protein [Candidatus Omnitrophota bacterium]
MSQPWGIVQARMSSKRLPGKVLKPVDGKPLLEYLLQRLEKADQLEKVMVITSVEESDNPIAEFCKNRGQLCYRGPLADVAGRFLEAVQHFKIASFVRINADSPMMDPRLVNQAVKLFDEKSVDLVSNVFKRSFPKGQSVEVVKSQTLLAAYPRMTAVDREHVTPFFYQHPEEFEIYNFEAPEHNYAAVNLSVDTPEDLSFFENAVKRAGAHPMVLPWLAWVELYKTAGAPAGLR